MSTLKKVPVKVLEKMNAVNLLRLYKSERNKFYAACPVCTCGCYMFMHELYPSLYSEQLYNEYKEYIQQIRSYLQGAGNVPNTKYHAQRVQIKRNRSNSHKTVRRVPVQKVYNFKVPVQHSTKN